MSRLREEIKACLQDPRIEEDGRMTAKIRFPEDFVGFQGHFPDRPVLPGVCLIEAVLALCREIKGCPLLLREAISAKFIAVAGSNETLTIECRETVADDGTFRVKGSVRRDGDRIAQVDLCLAREAGA